MKIVIFGATGKTGLLLTQKALKAGHIVTAFIRNPSKMNLQNDRFHVLEGDVFDAKSVANAIEGQDVVISVLGPTKNSPPNVMESAAEHILAGMRQHNVSRLVALTGAGVGDPQDKPQLWNRVISGLLKLISGRVLEDSQKFADKIRASNREWTLVRVPVLTTDPGTGHYQTGYVGQGMGMKIAREDVADFILKTVEENKHLHQAPVISNL